MICEKKRKKGYHLHITNYVIKCETMSDIVILIHKKREDLEEFIKDFPDTYIYVDTEENFGNQFIKRIIHSSINIRNVIGNGVRHIHEDFPQKDIIIVNECVTTDEVKKIAEELKKDNSIIIAKNENTNIISRKKRLGISIITKLYNMVHRQHASNIMSNVQGIPADKVECLTKLKGDTFSILINERFIIKDHNLDYRYIDVESNIFTDAPATLFGYIKSVLIICFIFIKFMLSSISAFIVDNGLAFLGYSLWSPIVVRFFASLVLPVPSVLLDVEIISTAIARIISSIYNYFLNKKVVFSADKNTPKLGTACKYFTLVLIIWVFNTIIMKLGTTLIGIPFPVAKITADIIMYFFSFTLQRDVVFKKRKER